MLKLCVLAVLLACAVVCGCHLTKWTNKRIEELDSDFDIPTAQETKSFAKRIDSEEFEVQKMEFTRKQLEKLTASDAFKRHSVKRTNT